MRVRALLAAALLLAGCEGGQRGWYIGFERMVEQPRYDPWEPSPVFPDGTIMQPPPAGTVPRDRAVGQPLVTHGLADGRYAERIPVPVTMALLERGRDRFGIYCAVCHGTLGDGRSVVAANMQLRPPPPLVEPPVTGFPPGRIYQVVRVGYGLMPSYEAELSVEDRWAVVAYVLALQRSQAVPAQRLPQPMRDRLDRSAAAAPEAR